MGNRDVKADLLARLQQAHQRTAGVAKSPNIRLPKDVAFSGDDSQLQIQLINRAVIANMQTDAAAFEGWALILKAWLQVDSIQLGWDLPTLQSDNEKQHYERFLFRVEEFERCFKSWFRFVRPPNFKSFWVRHPKPRHLNAPSKKREHPWDNKKDLLALSERALENTILGDSRRRGALCRAAGLKQLDNQLPVGLFHTSVHRGNEIFPSKASAIDIWGWNDANGVAIFELKKKGNTKVGAISELFFYSMAIRSLRLGEFEYEPGTLVKPKFENLSYLVRSGTVKAYLLAPDFHPLIDPAISGVLREMEQAIPDCRYGAIRICESGSFEEVQ